MPRMELRHTAAIESSTHVIGAPIRSRTSTSRLSVTEPTLHDQFSLVGGLDLNPVPREYAAMYPPPLMTRTASIALASASPGEAIAVSGLVQRVVVSANEGDSYRQRSCQLHSRGSGDHRSFARCPGLQFGPPARRVHVLVTGGPSLCRSW